MYRAKTTSNGIYPSDDNVVFGIFSGFLRSGNFEEVMENREGQGKVREF